MSLSSSIESVAETEGLSRSQVIQELEQAISAAALAAWGRARVLESQFDEATDSVLLYETLRVVEKLDPARNQGELELQTAEERFGAAVGDEISMQIFYRDEDAGAAKLMESELPSFQDVARGLPCPDQPTWMRQLWPHRRLPWRWDLPLSVPAFADALQILERSLCARSPDAPRTLGTARSDLVEFSALGPAARDVIAFYERFGPKSRIEERRSTMSVNLFDNSVLEFPSDALAHQTMMNQLLANNSIRGWHRDWLPVFGGNCATVLYCVDLVGAFGGHAGQVVSWDVETGERCIKAPSFGEWIGLCALAVELTVLEWKLVGEYPHPVLGFATGNHHLWFKELHGYVLHGYPKDIVD
jgi:hypothetical protein